MLAAHKIRRMSETPTTTTSQKVSQCTSHLYCNTPLICIAVLLVPPGSKEREILLLFVSQCSSHLYRNAPPICIAVLSGKSWWLWSPGCSPLKHSLEHLAWILENPRRPLGSRLSFPATGPPDPRRGFRRGLRRGLWRSLWRVSEGVSEGF